MPILIEWLRSARYYFVGQGVAMAGTYVAAYFPAVMLTTPSMTVAPTAGSASSVTAWSGGFYANFSATNQYSFNANADL